MSYIRIYLGLSTERERERLPVVMELKDRRLLAIGVVLLLCDPSDFEAILINQDTDFGSQKRKIKQMDQIIVNKN